VLDDTCKDLIVEVLKQLEDRVVLTATLRNGLYEVNEDLGADIETAAVSVKLEPDGMPEKPYTYAANKSQVQGRYGTKTLATRGDRNPLEIMHENFNHASERSLKAMLRNNAAFGMGTTYEACKDLHIRFCEVCQAVSAPRSERLH